MNKLEINKESFAYYKEQRVHEKKQKLLQKNKQDKERQKSILEHKQKLLQEKLKREKLGFLIDKIKPEYRKQLTNSEIAKIKQKMVEKNEKLPYNP